MSLFYTFDKPSSRLVFRPMSSTFHDQKSHPSPIEMLGNCGLPTLRRTTTVKRPSANFIGQLRFPNRPRLVHTLTPPVPSSSSTLRPSPITEPQFRAPARNSTWGRKRGPNTFEQNFPAPPMLIPPTKKISHTDPQPRIHVGR